jgi:hypothetical protein
MPNTQTEPTKHLKGFWPIFIIVIVSMVAGAVVFAFAQGNIMQDENNSISFWPRYMMSKSQTKTPPKTAPKTVAPAAK